MRLPLFAAVPLLLAPCSAFGQTVAPGTTSAPLQAESCFTDQAALCLGACIALCDLPQNSAEPFLNLGQLAIGNKWVVAAVRTDFSVAAAQDGAATLLDATISYDVGWDGLWTIGGVATGFNDARSEVTLTLRDLTTGAVLRTLTVHQKDVDGFLDIDIISIGAGRDRGSSVSSFSARLTRGHSYRLELAARCEAKAAVNATISLDYQSLGGGVWWNDLRVTMAPDLIEQIELLTRRVEALESHTHTYLTGKAEGHNNTEAETSMPLTGEEGPADGEETTETEETAARR